MGVYGYSSGSVWAPRKCRGKRIPRQKNTTAAKKKETDIPTRKDEPKWRKNLDTEGALEKLVESRAAKGCPTRGKSKDDVVKHVKDCHDCKQRL